MTKVLITGGSGQLGQSIQSLSKNYSSLELIFTDINQLDICNIEDVKTYTRSNQIDYLINCAAYTAVDKAEHEKTLAKKINADAVKNIAIAAKENNFKVIHISTDYVFDGKTCKPYTEDMVAAPTSYYGQTKLLGEKYLLENQKNAIIIRTAWLYSEFGHNFVKTMIKLGNERKELNVVADQVGSPTYALDLADTALNIIHQHEAGKQAFSPGIYHYSNEGICSWYDFTISIHQILGIDCQVSPIESHEYPTPAPRPFYSVLNKTKIKKTYEINIPHWRSSLENCLMTLTSKN